MRVFLQTIVHIGVLSLAIAGVASPARSMGTPSKIPQQFSNLCAPLIAQAERRHGIPARLLRAISLAESGRYDRRRKATIAWPWAVNAGGNARYHSSKSQAVAAVRQLRARGARNIDVGCMQVNLMHHPKAFRDLNAAFDPATNVAYAAGFLKRLHARTGSWIDAVAAYHSQVARRGTPYMLRVLRIWVDRRRPTRLAARSSRSAAKSLRPKAPLRAKSVRRSPSLVQRARALNPASSKRKWVKVVARRKRFAEWLAKRQAERRRGTVSARDPG